MLREQTLKLIEQLMREADIFEIKIECEDTFLHADPKNPDKSPPEYTIIITEHLWQNQIQSVLEIVTSYPNLESRLTDKGLEIYEVEPEDGK